MQQRGRKSTQSLVVVPLGRKPPPEPPDAIPPYAQRVWRDALASLPPDALRPGDLPLLEAYALSADIARQAREWLSKKYSPDAHRVLRDAINDLARLARALRLCPSTRTRADSAALQTTDPGERPWIDPATTV